MSRSDDVVPISFFALPGVVSVTPAALQLAREFGEHIGETRPGEAWITTFHWSDQRRVRVPGTNQWKELGAGLDLGAYRPSELPESVIQAIDGVEFAVMVPSPIYEKAVQRLIDKDDGAPSKLVLR
jgi:hypothetical protein